MEATELVNKAQYSLPKEEKASLMLSELQRLHKLHLKNSEEYKKISEVLFDNNIMPDSIESLPFLPVSAFKNHRLKSIKDDEIFKILTSSGTTGQEVSKIYLDKNAAKMQTLALSKILMTVIGSERLPMLIIDSKAIFKDKQSFSARGAGVLGVSVFGKDHTYILNENFEPDEKTLVAFLEKYSGKPILIFGFTFMVWQYLYHAKFQRKYDLSKAVLLHSGGWKKLTEISVDNDTFRKSLNEKFNLSQIFNFYGMIEQIGSVFLENSQGYLHCPNFADVIIRNPKDFSVQPNGVEGLIQTISILPESYPGHSLLTEDIGVIIGEDNAKNGWKGKYFKILGRAKKAELRGCSDTFKK